MSAVFNDRRHAGQALVQALRSQWSHNALVLAVPAGGVVLGYEVARAFAAPLEPMLIGQVSMPGGRGAALATVLDVAPQQWLIDEAMLQTLNPASGWLERQQTLQLAHLSEQRAGYCGSHLPLPMKGRDLLLIDDGATAGGTLRAALSLLGRMGARSLTLALPVAPRNGLELLRPVVDQLVCLATPQPFKAASRHYAQFEPVSEQEVTDLLARARRARVGQVG